MTKGAEYLIFMKILKTQKKIGSMCRKLSPVKVMIDQKQRKM